MDGIGLQRVIIVIGVFCQMKGNAIIIGLRIYGEGRGQKTHIAGCGYRPEDRVLIFSDQYSTGFTGDDAVKLYGGCTDCEGVNEHDPHITIRKLLTGQEIGAIEIFR